ncbi:hypothetical protein GJ744_000551 [Endocarpon pusillum]|uniref:Uncharacterized protein n=1 Tax=Endocarpon pusillum TaxID=364733 RepID=A0A8H7AEN6_9EURO|nr:hypothetical protein GJ744_000551 [Endocarpon pusillum]
MHSHCRSCSQRVSTSPCPDKFSKRRRWSLLDSEDALSWAKFVVIIVLAIIIIALSLQNPKDVLRSRLQFRSWYSQYVYQFSNFAQNNCTEPYSVYLYGTRQNISQPTISGAGKFTLFVQPMINCLLENSSEYLKYQLGSSQVMLGITPTIIALLGASSEELCLLALIGRRRLLGLLLATASPSIYTERAFKYQDPDKILTERQYHSHHGEDHVKPTMHSNLRWFFVSLEYIAVFCAIANIATLNWELGVKTINTVNPNTVFMPMLWSLVGVMAHCAGAVVFDMRARRLDKGIKPMPRSTLRSCFSMLTRQSPWPTILKTFTACKEMAVREVCWGTEGPKEKLYFDLIPESRCFTSMGWTLSVLVVFHMILGTLIMASTSFVGPKNALGIMARYILSVVICRIIVVYELAVLRVEYKNAAADVCQCTVRDSGTEDVEEVSQLS